MKKDQVIQILQEKLEDIKKFHVKSLSIFGSVARDESTDTSDVDILVEFNPDATVWLFMFIRLKQYLRDILGCDVDLATPRSIRKDLK